MKEGKAFEILVQQILLCAGFSQVDADGMYIYNDPAVGLMIQGLAEAHNADVLMEPPVQTPFYSRTRLLVECKDYSSNKRVGLDILRSALGLREDINHFNIIDSKELKSRQKRKRYGLTHTFDRYTYQVAVASMNGFTVQGQNFAAAHRIPLIGFDKMPFWDDFCRILNISPRRTFSRSNILEDEVTSAAKQVGSRMAIAITNSGQMLFLYRVAGWDNEFGDYYSLHWNSTDSPWVLRTDECEYLFQLPDAIMRNWLENTSTELEKKRSAIDCKERSLAHMVVYYRRYNMPAIKMISIDRGQLAEARSRLMR